MNVYKGTDWCCSNYIIVAFMKLWTFLKPAQLLLSHQSFSCVVFLLKQVVSISQSLWKRCYFVLLTSHIWMLPDGLIWLWGPLACCFNAEWCLIKWRCPGMGQCWLCSWHVMKETNSAGLAETCSSSHHGAVQPWALSLPSKRNMSLSLISNKHTSSTLLFLFSQGFSLNSHS